ncbi:dihydrolipoyllysine-residue acetyltransferase [Pseudomonas syringae]|uniref:Acetyltransferase component of pyruvate dehydrogenase complex n=1 Tax=Pseudomonas syringae pv. papulans TaxID=83963 RepID=A0A0P9X389_PSESX|nr:dihydrolipoyllysine-residue acetyltransferase [Pseudomonas syringae]KPY27836.1 Dihydrolipoamide acetyltransferase [Pseudomonas syringae pv. papulans]KWS41792.1 pyruvate dehydrogenase complex dihydrolipoyllysine-residue acetyltransferase [Pseudomonas syringae pv. papulans]MDH4603500.1 dihydrolipoyllysine-residue acetyltransferase [Pseudomonas syringae pv. papulans]MDH4620761.1 dihydrolipoyllysine-residue acetyltransferase [Pseudomonas syringae pv. papulans]RMN50204.1 Dihydrolipoamide acetylt
MSELIRVPDIGNGEGEVIELMVKVGDRIEADQSILTLESDKASMEIPAPKAGVIKTMKVKLGDRLKEGDELFELEVEGEAAAAPAPAAEPAAAPAAAEKPAEAAPAAAAPAPAASASVQDIHVPDIGSSGKAKIIELMVKVGDSIQADQSLITLESDKASMEIPSPAAGVVESIEVKLDQEVGTGDLILKLKLKVEGAAPAAAPAPAASAPAAAPAKAEAAAPAAPAPKAEAAPAPAAPAAPAKDGAKVHAGPAVRQLAREFGVELSAVSSTGPHGRVLKEDVQAYVKTMMQKAKEAPAGGASGGSGIPPIPEVDFSRFGEIEEVPMTRLMQLGASGLHRSWLNIPHVTQFDQADITDLEAFRVAQKGAAEKAGVKLTVLPLLLKSCAHLLKELPDFNASLAPSGKAVIRKKYVHIGFAVDTPDGLLVPVIRDVDQKSLLQLAAEAAALAEKARNKKLTANDMQGACFTISSLGHIGGTGFTPIVNAPEVAILGVSKATIQPVWDGKAFQPKLMLPLSLSYDHRVINGAAAARFTKRLSELLADIRTILL